MTEDLILKTLTGLMMEQRTMTQSQRLLTGKVQTLGETVKILAETVEDMSRTNESLTESSERQEQRFGELLEVMTQFSSTSTDTRKRVAALEREVEKLKNAS